MRSSLWTGEHDPHAIIECKGVAAADAGLAREYVVEGIDRFRTGKYSENHARGFMVAYVLSGTPQAVVDEITAISPVGSGLRTGSSFRNQQACWVG